MTRCLRGLLLAATMTLVAPAAASAGVAHVVAPGESLWSLAAAQNMTTRAFAAANGLPEDARIVAGAAVQLPTVGEAAGALSSAAPAVATPAASSPAAPAAPSPPVAPVSAAGYTVRPGDTLSGLAAAHGVGLARFAQQHGLDPDAPLLSGTVLRGAAAGSGAAPAAPAASPSSPPAPSASSAAPARVSAADVSGEAAAQGVPGSLAAAIAWQESGFNNAMVSSASARGVMQVMPGTWDSVQANLATRRLDRGSARDNVSAGVLYLGSLLRSAGGDPATAAAGYYQGPASVARIGMLPETRRYVANVLALRGRFGG